MITNNKTLLKMTSGLKYFNSLYFDNTLFDRGLGLDKNIVVLLLMWTKFSFNQLIFWLLLLTICYICSGWSASTCSTH